MNIQIEHNDKKYILSEQPVVAGDDMWLKEDHSHGRFRHCYYTRIYDGMEHLYIDALEDEGWGFCYQHEVNKLIPLDESTINPQ